MKWNATLRMQGRSVQAARPALERMEEREVPALIGALDPSFGSGGKVTVAAVPLVAEALQADGKIVVVGSTASDFYISRFNPDGTLDTSFNATGVQKVDFGATDVAQAIALQANGKIDVVGSSAGNFAIAQLNPNGTLDAAFGAGGKAIVDLGGPADAANAVAIQADGKIVLVGTGGAAPTDFAAARLNASDGTLDASFNGTGKVLLSFAGTPDSANAVAIQPDGKIVLAGSNGADFAIARLTSSGVLDTSFDVTGEQTVDLGGVSDAARAIALQPDGKILLAGSNGADIAVARLNGNGSLDTTSFGPGGKVLVDINGIDDARSIVVLPTGKILVGGDSSQNIALVRLNSIGTLDTTFNATGKAQIDASGAGTNLGNAIAVTPTGRIVVAGSGPASVGQLIRVSGTVEESATLAVGGSTNAQAQVYSSSQGNGQFNATSSATIAAFGSAAVNVRTAVADVNGDGIPDVVLVTGPGTPLRVAVVSGKDNSTVLVQPFDPFGGNFTGGGFVSTGDFTGDGRSEFVVTPDQGGGPRVTIFELQAGGLITLSNFFGISDPAFRGGARSAVGDINGDGTPDLVVGAGFGGGPRIAVYDGKTVLGNNLTEFVSDFFAFGDQLRNGAYVAVGDANGDGYGDLIFGAGPGGGPELLAISGKQLLTGGSVNAIATPLANFFVAGNNSDRGGVRVAVKDVDGDNKVEVVAGTGGGQAARVRVYTGSGFVGTGEPTAFQDIIPFSSTVLADGVYVG